MKVKEEIEKVGLKLNIQKTKIMASGSITSWQIDGETVETVSGFILGGSTTTSDCNCSHEIKIYLLLGRKFVTNLDSILKSRDVTLSTKVGLVKAVVFLVIMTERLHFHFSLSCIGEGNGNSLQYSCLENPRDGEAWWAAIWGCTESATTEVT